MLETAIRSDGMWLAFTRGDREPPLLCSAVIVTTKSYFADWTLS